MFAAIGRFTYAFRYTIIAVLFVSIAATGVWGFLGLGAKTKMNGLYDEASDSVASAQVTDKANGREMQPDILVLIKPAEGKKISDEDVMKAVAKTREDVLAKFATGDDAKLNPLNEKDPQESSLSYTMFAPGAPQANDGLYKKFTRTDADGGTWGFFTLPMKSADDTQRGKDWVEIQKPLMEILQSDANKATFEARVGGLVPVTSEVTEGVQKDQKKAEIIALPLVAIVLFFVYGGIVAAVLPMIIGVLTIGAAMAVASVMADFTDVNLFVGPIISLIGLGIAHDYGLFMVSRFREELDEGYDTPTAVRRTVMTAGRTVVMSSLLIVAALACLYISPLGLLTSMATGALLGVFIAALLSLVLLPAMLGVLGPRVFALSFHWFLTIFDKWNLPLIGGVIHWAAEKTGRAKTKANIEAGMWGKVTDAVMKRPKTAIVAVVTLLLAICIPIVGLQFGGISQTYLPPTNETRQTQDKFQELFPDNTGQPVKIVFTNASDEQIKQVLDEANKIPGFTHSNPADPNSARFSAATDAVSTAKGTSDKLVVRGQEVSVRVSNGSMQDPNDTKAVGEAVAALRSIKMDGADPSKGVGFLVGGMPVLQYDSIDSMISLLPNLMVLLVLVTTLAMFLAFGSLTLPIKAVLMSLLSLGSTLGFLTWMFVEGHGGDLFNFTGGPMMAPVLVLVIAVVFGLSTDYEVFVISRMIEERAGGATTNQAIRAGTANTGRIITAAAILLACVAAAFATSDLVMLKYVSFGLIFALLIDATVVRMVLVPAVMKLLGDDSWWAPVWMRKIQEAVGLGETSLPAETRDGRPLSSVKPASAAPGKAAPELVGAGAPASATRAPAAPDDGRLHPPSNLPDVRPARPTPVGPGPRRPGPPPGFSGRLELPPRPSAPTQRPPQDPRSYQQPVPGRGGPQGPGQAPGQPSRHRQGPPPGPHGAGPQGPRPSGPIGPGPSGPMPRQQRPGGPQGPQGGPQGPRQPYPPRPQGPGGPQGPRPQGPTGEGPRPQPGRRHSED
ncbi:MMPL family transporter [Tsukamurella paurometabola]|uniref:MMPL family transporter n=1 Tax=Tsukamurella paurometabola TaxID=2061 RepID=A0A3P8KPR3_TSUPA|nr:MMPL family transporter [Tsukamurella paurometabola]MBS4099953.1 MMPL family transporter [Tsukamurella paurometabola]UEA81124.1 MMPL family transporter [Tsukamurella paurometabola]VDR38097.1 Membrane transport protein mmpL8 [Tsukamurella paurometabola]